MALRDKLRAVLSTKDSPKKIALSFSVGIFIGMSPLLGLHTVLGIFVAWAFRLNKFVTVIGLYITNPWTVVPIYTFATWIGARLLGMNHIIPDLDRSAISFSYILREMEPLIWPFIFGTTLCGFIAAGIGYVIIYKAALRNKND
ncbi:MAG: DUF2062 domain-containing protein [Dissulfurispiraceae bacterium]